jgi:hypothetical protein
VFDARHAVSYNKSISSGFNNIHIDNLDTNIDFHGGVDKGNIYYVENMKVDPFFVVEAVKGVSYTPEIADGYGQVQFHLIDYRHAGNEQENTVIWDNVISHGKLNDPGANGHVGGTLSDQQNDALYASDNGALLYGGYGNDKLTGGKGEDHFVYDGKSGSDTIIDFEHEHDMLFVAVENFATAQSVLNAAHQIGTDVVIDLGANTRITLEDVLLSDLHTQNVVIITSINEA